MTMITYIYQVTNSATLASTVSMISMLSQLFSGGTVPLIMERFSLKRIVLLSQLFQLIFYVSIIFFLFIVSHPFIITILALIILGLITFFNGWSNPTRSALIPEIVSKDKLVNANSVLSTTNQTLLLLGWSLGGVFVVYFGHEKVIFITILLLLVSIISLIMIKMNGTEEKKVVKDKMNTLKEGWIIVFKHPTLSTITKMDIIELFGGSIWIGAVTLVFVQESLGKDETWWGYINSAYYAGTILGGILVWKFSKLVKNHLILWIIIGSIGVSILTVIYSLNSIPMIALLLVILMGPLYQVRDIAQNTFVQNVVPSKDLAKYLAAKSSLNQLIFSLSIVIIGVLVDIINARLVYLFSGILLLCSGLYGYLKLFKKYSAESQSI